MNLREYTGRIWDLSSIQSLLGWDQDTHMPPGGAEARARSAAVLEGQIHGLMTNPRLADLARAAMDSFDELTREAGQYWLDTYEDAKCVPEALSSALVESSSITTSVWHECTTFEEIQPYLEKLVDLTHQFAACYPDYKPYDALIDCYEYGVTQEHLDSLFNVVKPALLEMRGSMRPQGEKKKLEGTRHALMQLCRDVTEWMGYDYNSGNLSETEHPFMASLHKSDVRIAAALRPKDPIWTLFSSVHEAGHALYEQNAEYSEWFSLDSSGLHESQSLFWETMVGRSDLFWDRWFDAFNRTVGFGYIDRESLLADINHNDTSNLIRLQAGELDYGLHILLRYELERDLFSNGLEVKDMPARFNELSTIYFGRSPKEDRVEGVLQDTHWPSGMFGYFPSYLLGAAFAAQQWEKSPKDSPEAIRTFLHENVHRHGGRYGFTDLTDKFGGFDPQPYLRHLRRVYVDR